MISSYSSELHVLYLHPAPVFGGAAKSLIEMFGQLRKIGVEGTVLTADGQVCSAFAKSGMNVITVWGLTQFDNTRYGYYRRLRWLILLRELCFLPFSFYALWNLRRSPFDIIHINEITLLPLGILAKLLLGLPLVVHVRSLQRSHESSICSRILNSFLQKYSDAVIAIDYTVAKTLDEDLLIHVIHNGIHLSAYTRIASPQNSDAPVLIGFIGVLIALKGIFELAEAMRILKERGVRVECVVAGENVRDVSRTKAWVLKRLGFSRDVRAELEEYISQNDLQDYIKILGFVDDVHMFYSKIDVLCFPSHLNAAGRPVFEAALHGVPSIVAVDKPMPDAIVDGITGLAIAKSDPVLIANAIQMLVEDRDLREKLGKQAQKWALENFDIEKSACQLYKIYAQLLE